jgi:hypothetical protein
MHSKTTAIISNFFVVILLGVIIFGGSVLIDATNAFHIKIIRMFLGFATVVPTVAVSYFYSPDVWFAPIFSLSNLIATKDSWERVEKEAVAKSTYPKQFSFQILIIILSFQTIIYLVLLLLFPPIELNIAHGLIVFAAFPVFLTFLQNRRFFKYKNNIEEHDIIVENAD